MKSFESIPSLSPSLLFAGFNSVQFTHSVMSNSLQPHGWQHASLLCPSPTAKTCSNSCPSSWWCHPTILQSSSPPAFYLSQHQNLFQWVNASHQVVKLLEFHLQHQSFQWLSHDWFPLGLPSWISCSSGDSQESSRTPQFKSINSLVLSFFYSPTLTSIHDYWKNHSFD